MTDLINVDDTVAAAEGTRNARGREAGHRRGRPRVSRGVQSDQVLPALEPQAEFSEKMAALKLAGFTDAEIAEATATTESAVGKWRSATLPAPAARNRLDRVRAAMLYLVSHGVSPAGAYGWLTGIDPELDWQSPLTLIRNDEFDRVIKRLSEISPREPLGTAHD